MLGVGWVVLATRNSTSRFATGGRTNTFLRGAISVSYTHLDVYKRQIKNCQSNWILAFVALGVVIVCNIWGKGMVKILPILIGVLVSYAVALVTGAVDFQRISEAAWVLSLIHI